MPAVLVLGLAWLVVLKHRLSALLPFFLIVAVISGILQFTIGLSPLAFFVSFGGYIWLVAVAWISAAIVREIDGAIRTNRRRR